jgi:ABC-2 type transport system ATP-binding protein
VSEATIEVTGLRKRFGATQALDGMTFSVKPGTVTGFVGPNGAGKSTTVRVILGLDAPDAGRALVGGHQYHQLQYPLRHVGALVDAGAVHPSRSGRNHLLWIAQSQKLPAARVDEVIEMVGLTSAGRRKAGGYSLGMRQRLGIAAALLGDPPVLILDEPFNGLDPEGFIWIRRLLRSLAGEGRAILVSSHLMTELQDIADQVVVVGRGKVLADATVSELIALASGGDVIIRTTATTHALTALQDAGATASLVGDNTIRVTGSTAQASIDVLSKAGIPIDEVATQKASLEDIYFQLTSEQTEFAARLTDRTNR